MKTMLKENKENPSVKKRQPISDLLMKPFSLGWTREVVRRVVTHCGTPNCDIYYFNPNKKKLRSLTEVKSNLTDGLSVECFSFKRELLGLGPDLETVRDAKVRGKGGDKSKEKKKVSESVKRPVPPKNPEEEEEDANDSGKKAKKKKTKDESKPDAEAVQPKEEESDTNNVEEKSPEKEKEEPVAKPRRAKSERTESKESKTFSSRTAVKTRGKTAKPTKPPAKPVRLQTVKSRKSALKRVLSTKQAKQAKVVPSRKTLKGIRKKVAPPKRKLSKPQSDKKAGSKSKKNSSKIKTVKRPGSKTKSEVAKSPETNDTDNKKPTARDLKSIVKKNIGKYREMREKQKLGAVKNQARNSGRKITISHIPRARSEPISKNKPFYLKPLEKGWRRELVYRTNCAKAGQQADVYYFHPNGKKLRSCREIAENLTQGLSIECFTFKKEPLGCGEPSEVIRNARSIQKN